MLKSCWDCFLGYSREQANNEIVHGVELNGNGVRAPPWPGKREEKEIMFLLPKILSNDDKVTITGTLSSNTNQFAINLVTGNNFPDFNNIACQFKATFGYDDKISVKILENGTEVYSNDQSNYTASDAFGDGRFAISFKIREGNVADVYVDNDMFITECKMIHNVSDIRFLNFTGDIEKVNRLDFEFGDEQ